jgi:hypothetical protein
MKVDLDISDRTHMALARAKEIAGPDESGPFEPEAKVFMDSLATDICKAMLRPVEGLFMWIVWTQEIAREFGK